MTPFSNKHIVLVDDEPYILKATKLSLLGHGFSSVATISDSKEVLPYLQNNKASVILLDLTMSDISGMELLPQIVSLYPQTVVIVITAIDDTSNAVDCMKSGAFDYLVKPVETSRLLSSIEKALEVSQINRELSTLKDYLLSDRLANPEAFAEILTNDKKMRAVFQYAEVIAQSTQPILIEGETGVGKDMLAQAIHKLQCRKGEFVAVNIAGLDDAVFSDTLFGHKKGAFTGADQARDGLVSKASGGTLFLDEIGDLNEASQIKLLRLLQSKEYYPVGSDAPKKTDARIIVATNCSLKDAMNAGKFRKDLYYRLSTHQIKIPPLRERRDDITLLTDYFIKKAAAAVSKQAPNITNEFLCYLQSLDYNGNVRELESIIFDAVTTSNDLLTLETINRNGEEINFVETTNDTKSAEEKLIEIFGHFPTIEEIQSRVIEIAINKTKGHQGDAANLLGITRQTLNKKLGELRRG